MTRSPRSDAIDRRTVLRAAAAAGSLSLFGQRTAAREGGGDAENVPDVLVTNLDDQPRSATLALDAAGEDVAAARTAVDVEVEPGAHDRIRDLAGGVGARGAGPAADGGATLRLSDDRGASDAVPIRGDFSRSNRIAYVSLRPASTTLSLLHYDGALPTPGGD